MNADARRLAQQMAILDPAGTARAEDLLSNPATSVASPSASASRVKGEQPLSQEHRALLRRIISTPAEATITADRAAGAATPTDTRRIPGRNGVASVSAVPRGRFSVPIFARIAVVLIAIVLVVLLATTPTNTAVARTPPPLQFQPTSLTQQEVQAMLAAQLSSTSGIVEAQRQAHSVGWYLQYTEGEESASSAISPQIADLRWSEDRSGRFTVTAGVPYVSVDAERLDPGDAPAPGTVLIDETYGAGEYDVPLSTEVPGDSPYELRQRLEEYGVTESSTGFELIEGVAALLSVWTLTDRQHAALQELLLSQSDIRVHGTTVDRAGRPVIGVAADSQTGNRDVLLFSTETGRIAGLETIRTTAWGEIPAGATTAYTIWGTTP